MICWIQVSAGRGPAECGWAAAMAAKEILREAGELKIKGDVLEAIPHERPNTLKSALISLEGENADNEIFRPWRPACEQD